MKRVHLNTRHSMVSAPLLSLCMVIGLLMSACNLPGSDSSGQNASSSPGTTATPVRQAPAPLPGNHSVADKPATGKLPLGQPLPANEIISLTFNLLYNDAALERSVLQIYTPGSPTFHQYLTPQQIRQSFGPSDAQLQEVRQWLTSQGYTIVSTDDLATAIQVTAPVATIERSLHIQLQQYNVSGHVFYMQNSNPTLPGSIGSLVQSIVGLNNFALPRFWSGHSQLSSQGVQADCSKYGAHQTLTRTKLAAAYQFNRLYQQGLQGQGMTIGIAEFDEPFDPQDVATYAACAGVPAPHIQIVNVIGHTPAGPGEGEAALDVELASSLAPQAQILVYQASTATAQAMLTVFRRVAAERRVQVFSVSYGAAEGSFSSNEQAGFNQALLTMAGEGISVFISSGDCGAFTERIPNIAVVSAPANAPYAIAVGGTTLKVSDQNVRISETAWGPASNAGLICTNDWGTGGGVSENQQFKRPNWQVGSGTNTHYDGTSGNILTPDLVPVVAPNGLRQVPDVAAAADNIAIFWNRTWVRVGGTSAAAPIWAAGTVLVDQGLRQQHDTPLGSVPTLYTLANNPHGNHPFTDIVSGNNGFYNATRGWDYTTGWGSPNFYDMLNLMQLTEQQLHA
jgi:kumamolisin